MFALFGIYFKEILKPFVVLGIHLKSTTSLQNEIGPTIVRRGIKMELLKTKFHSTEKILLPRIKRELAADYGSNSIDATPTAVRMMFTVSPYVDYDGLIHLTKVQIREKLGVCSSFIARTLESAKHANFIEEREGRLYSLVHTFEKAKSSEFKFIQNYSRLVDGRFPNVGKWAMRLFMYILGSSVSGRQVVKLENLYRNNLHTVDNGLNYFPDARRVVDALVRLLHHDLIQVEFPVPNKSERTVLNKENAELHRILLEEYAGIRQGCTADKENGTRKKRTSSLQSKNHLLVLSISESVTSSKERVKASQTELNLMLEENNYSVDLLRESTVTSIIGIKNALYFGAGEIGLSIYRKSFSQFLSQKMPLIDYYDQQEYKVYNHFINYYVLTSVQSVLLQVAKNSVLESKSTTPNEFVTAYGTIKHKEVKGLLNFFNDRASRNHNVIMEKLLSDLNFKLHNLEETKLPWKKIFEKAAAIRFNFLVHENVQLPPRELRELTYELATNNLLHLEEKYREYVTQFINSKYPFYDVAKAAGFNHFSGDIPNDEPKKIQFYNWLEDRS